MILLILCKKLTEDGRVTGQNDLSTNILEKDKERSRSTANLFIPSKSGMIERSKQRGAGNELCQCLQPVMKVVSEYPN